MNELQECKKLSIISIYKIKSKIIIVMLIKLCHRSTKYLSSIGIEPLIQPYLTTRKQQYNNITTQTQTSFFEGSYTIQGTNKFTQKHKDILMKSWNSDKNSKISNIGIGTYKGSLDQQDDILQFNAIVDSVLSGVNMIDTCHNFRGGRSEIVISRALKYLVQHKKYDKSQICIATKAGYVRQKLSDELAKQVINQHCVHPKYLEQSLNRSLQNLKLKTVDIFYVNNFGQAQLQKLGRENFQDQLAKVFQFCQKARSQNKIKYYGLASWQCFRLASNHAQYLNLNKVAKIAQKVGGAQHGFKFLQVPINIMMPESFAQKNQDQSSLLEAAQSLKINVVSCSPLLSGSLINVPLPSDKLNCRSNGAKHLQLIRSIPSPALVCTLIGQKTNRHTKKNLEVLKTSLLNQQQWFEIFVPNEEPNKVQP